MLKVIKRKCYTPTPVVMVMPRSSKFSKFFCWGDCWKAENKRVFKKLATRYLRRKEKMNLVNLISE